MNIEDAYEPALPTDLNDELLRLSQKLSQAQDELKTQAINWASSEHRYKRAKALAYLGAKTATEKKTVAEIEAIVDRDCEVEREAAYIARALKESGLENVRSLRAQLSALQSVAASVRSEAELYGKVQEPVYR